MQVERTSISSETQKTPLDDQTIRKSIFQTFNKAHHISSCLPEFSICIMGMTRSGKSTTYNLITNPKILIGKDQGCNTFYQMKRNDSKAANINSEMKSVTIMPNATKLESNLFLIDFPGFGDRRVSSQVLLVNYINGKFMHSLKKTKFLVIFTQQAFSDLSHNGFRETLQNFLSFFDMNLLGQERYDLFRSISFCLTLVDFKGKPYQKVKEKYIDQLGKNLQKLEECYKENELQMPYFPAAKELILDIIKTKRIELFELARDAEEPQNMALLKRLNENKWEFFNIAANIDKVVYHYQKQYGQLEKKEQEELDNIIKWRFEGFCLNIRKVMGTLFNYVANNIGQRQINLKSYFSQLANFMKDLPEYQEKEIIEAPVLSRIQHKLVCFERLLSLTTNTKYLNDWKRENTFHPIPPAAEYFTRYLTQIINDQLINVKTLLTQSLKEEQGIILNRLKLHFQKMLIQAAIFSKLSNELNSYFSTTFMGELSFTSEVPILIKIKTGFIQYFATKDIPLNMYKPSQLKEIISICGSLKRELGELSPLLFYRISVKINHLLLLAEKINRKNSNKLEPCLQQAFSTLIETIKPHTCLTLVILPRHEQQIFFLRSIQQQVIKEIGNLISPNSKRQIQFHGNLRAIFQYIYKATKPEDLKSFFQMALHTIFDFSRCFSEINLRNCIQMDLPITYSSEGYEQQLSNIIREYSVFKRDDILQYQYRLPPPHYPSVSNQIKHQELVISKIRGKKVTYILGQELSGKTLFMNILKGKKIVCNAQGKYDIENSIMGSRINHSNIPDRFINISPKDQDQMYVQMPSFYYDINFIRMCMIQNIAKSSSEFKVILIQKQQDFRNNKLLDHIRDLLKLKIVNKNNLSVIINGRGMVKNQARAIFKEIVAKVKQSNLQKQLFESINAIVIRGRFFCEEIGRYSELVQDFNNSVSEPLSFEQPINHYDIFQVFSESGKKKMIEYILLKAKILKKCVIPLVGLASDAWKEYKNRIRLTQKRNYYNDIYKIFTELNVNRQNIDLSRVADYASIARDLQNNVLIYSRLIKIKAKGKLLSYSYQYENTYKCLIDYLTTFFNNLAYICCTNQAQIRQYNQIKIVVISILEQMQFYCQIFKEYPGFYINQQFDYLGNQLRLRDVLDNIDNFSDDSQQDLLKEVIKINARRTFSAPDLNNYLDLLNYICKRSEQQFFKIQIYFAAQIELLILIVKYRSNNTKSELNWDSTLTEQRLIDSFGPYIFSKGLPSSKLQIIINKKTKIKPQQIDILEELSKIRMALLNLVDA